MANAQPGFSGEAARLFRRNGLDPIISYAGINRITTERKKEMVTRSPKRSGKQVNSNVFSSLFPCVSASLRENPQVKCHPACFFRR